LPWQRPSRPRHQLEASPTNVVSRFAACVGTFWAGEASIENEEAMVGTWRDMQNAPNFACGTMLLLTDGSVLCQVYNAQQWRRLMPDGKGDFAAGQWLRAENSRNAPLYYASAVLSDGTVFVAGGEYNFDVETDLCAVDLYDPVSDSWTALSAPANWTVIGDAPCCVLPDGSVLLGSIRDGMCVRFDPGSRGWSSAGQKLNKTSSEETWTLLPDGSVLTADCIAHPASERFMSNGWRQEGNLPSGADLVDDASSEIGPAILLPDGRVFAIGATGKTALFQADRDAKRAGTWTAGPVFPQENGEQLGAKDAPACLLTNGRVLCAVGPVDPKQGGKYSGPTIFFEYDPSSNRLVRLPDSQQPVLGWTNYGPYMSRMLLLPTGEVLFNNNTDLMLLYTPDGSPKDEWRPRIRAIPKAARPGGQFTLVGEQLNGLSQACSYGDDASMATNYPLVRVREASGAGTVRYCRTFGHSTMAVATANARHSTNVSLPEDLVEGDYELQVIANGIASAVSVVRISRGTAAG
jgi:hypothetical protein